MILGNLKYMSMRKYIFTYIQQKNYDVSSMCYIMKMFKPILLPDTISLQLETDVYKIEC